MFQIIIKSNVVFTVIFTNDSIAYHEKWVYFQSPVLLYHPFFYYFNFWFAVRILHVHLELTTNCNKNNHNFNLTCCLRVSLAWTVLDKLHPDSQLRNFFSIARPPKSIPKFSSGFVRTAAAAWVNEKAARSACARLIIYGNLPRSWCFPYCFKWVSTMNICKKV